MARTPNQIAIDVRFLPPSKTRPQRWRARVSGQRGSYTRPQNDALDTDTNVGLTAGLFANRYLMGVLTDSVRTVKCDATHYRVIVSVL